MKLKLGTRITRQHDSYSVNIPIRPTELFKNQIKLNWCVGLHCIFRKVIHLFCDCDLDDEKMGRNTEEFEYFKKSRNIHNEYQS